MIIYINDFINIIFLIINQESGQTGNAEAKKEEINPLFAKEQARKYAISVNCRFIILSNGNIHYFWDKEKGNPTRISHFPTLESLESLDEFTPDKNKIIEEKVEYDYVAKTQNPHYDEDPRRKDESKR